MIQSFPVDERFTGDFMKNGLEAFHIGGHTPGYTIYIYRNVLFICDYAFPPGPDMRLNPHGPEDETLMRSKRILEIINEPLYRTYREMKDGIKRGNVGLYEQVSGFQPDLSLGGLWKFRPGDNPDFKRTEFDDKHWKDILVPAIWQTQGYKDMHGFAWYRKRFIMKNDLKDERLILLLGKIDDLDETYLNGRLLGKTVRIRDDADAIHIQGDEWSILRAYYIPSDYLKFDGLNTIAVRVFDGPMHGGIYEGPIGIVSRDRYLKWKNRFVPNNWKNIFELIFGTDTP